MRDLLDTYYGIVTEEDIVLDKRHGHKNGNYIYFIISAPNKEAIHMEQATLAYYLAENNYDNIAVPVPSVQGDWLITNQGKSYLALRLSEQPRNHSVSSMPSSGQRLAEFHRLGSMYQYEPTAVSSYGQWKKLWIEKLTMFENHLAKEAMEYPCPYHHLVMNTLPYIIGISENAIQYVQENEQESRFNQVDQGTITFNRYQDQIHKPVIWTDTLVYDHPVRDLAEYIRASFLQEEDQSESIREFVYEYQSIRPLSVFSWRMLYARLIFPVHLFDVMERGLLQKADYEQLYKEMNDLLARQDRYEQRLGRFFEDIGFDHHKSRVPVLHWL